MTIWCGSDEDDNGSLVISFQILKLVLQYNACCMIKDMNHKTALHVAVEMGKVNHVEAMCRAALSCISLGDDAKRTPLHYAVINRKK